MVTVFRPKRLDRIKVLWWDGTGLVLAHKRLEQGRFAWPSIHDGSMRLRDALRERLWLQGVSLAIGRNKAYLQQYLARGMPRVLSHQDTATLGKFLGCDPGELRHDTLPVPKPWKRRKRPGGGGSAMATVAEMEVEAAAGPGAWHEEFVMEKARWRLPEGMVRHEGDADPEALRILRVCGNSMEPEMREGDRVVVDTARRVPGVGELFVLWDGDWLVVKRVEPAHEPGPPRLRLLSANPDYPPYTRLAADVHIVGKVLWKVTRA